MRFSGDRQVAASLAEVWVALHDREVLLATIPGCEEMFPLDGGVYAATLRARVGPVTDTYEGSFSIQDVRPGSQLRVRVAADGRCGRLAVDLQVTLAPGRRPGTTSLRYVADATLGGVVARLGRVALTMAGSHFTASFFRDLDDSIREAVARGRLGAADQRAAVGA